MKNSILNFLSTTLIPELSSNILYTLGFPIFKYGSRLYIIIYRIRLIAIIVVERLPYISIEDFAASE
nr:MAG TPA: hypothetical protein [Caudoviricetes sp.]